MSENKYRDYLRDDRGFYDQYLKTEDEPVGSSSFGKFIMAAGATVGLAAGTAAAYRHGAFKGTMEKLIDNLGSYRQTNLGSTLDSVRAWTKDDFWDEIDEMDSKALKLYSKAKMFSDLPDYLAKGKAARSARLEEARQNPIIQDKGFELHTYIKQMETVLYKQREEIKGVKSFTRAKELVKFHRKSEDMMHETMKAALTFSKEAQDEMLKRTGYQQATTNDVWSNLPSAVRDHLQRFEDRANKRGYSIKDKVIDTSILMKKGNSGTNKFADLRDFKDSIAKSGDMIAEDFTIPFIKINPFRMFYLNEFTKNTTPQMFGYLGNSKTQPFMNHGLYNPTDQVFINGRVFSMDHNTIDANKGPQLTATNQVFMPFSTKNDGYGSLIARNTKNMMNLYEGKVEYTPAENWFKRNVYAPIMKTLDLGYQNERIGHNSEYADPASYGSWIANKLFNGFGGWKGLKPYEDRFVREPAFGEGSELLMVPRYKTLKEVNEAGGGFKDYAKQFMASSKNPEDVTLASFILYTFAERINATLNQVGLGLSAKHLGSAQEIFTQLTLRRVAPIAVGVAGIQYTNAQYENIFGEEYEDQLAKGFVDAQTGMARVRDQLGITDWAKDMAKVMPGIEFLSELPIPVVTTEGMTPVMLKDLMPLNQSEEELKTYYSEGEEKVRKGRYWEFGNTPLTGGKVDYFQPNWYRRITTDWEYTDTLWGSKEEYWDNHWLTSPIKHFITDPYHWEKKHYEDRPYMVTGGIPEIEQLPLIGPLLNETVGQILKPRLEMHKEEWENPDAVKEKLGFKLAQSLGIIESQIGGPFQNGGVVGVQSGFGPSEENRYEGQMNYGEPLAYVTSSGNISVMAAASTTDIQQVNRQLQEVGIGKTGAASDIRLEQPELLGNPESLANPAGINMALGNVHYNMTEMGGFYGWVSTMATNQKGDQYDPRIMTSTKAFGYERAFWDSDYGNMGADGMEIFRRFLPRDAHKNYVNPLDNNMPTWLPGEEYFTNFQEGDPYVKLKKGEMRLPGESYEKLYNIDGDKLMDLEVGASLIGYDTDKIVGHWLHRDDIQSMQKEFVTERGTAWHKAWEKDMDEQGIAISMEQYVKDEKTGIGGFYDVYANHEKAMKWMLENAVEFNFYEKKNGTGSEEYGGYYADPVDILKMSEEDKNKMIQQLLQSSKNVLLDPKTRSDEKFENGKMQFENTQQVNFYASQMGTNINYLVHADPDSPEKGLKIQAFEYSPELLAETTNKVQVAREAVYQMMEDGAIGRGDLYNPIDRYRILADVAPYSEEYRKLKAQLANIDFTPEEKKEIQEINDQVSERKEHVRTYDYRFKTADVQNMTVTVKEVLDNNMFLTKEFGDNPIRLAGVYVPTGQDEIGQAATKMVRRYIREGHKLQISVNADEQNLVNNDTYKTISAVVRAGDIRNLNRQLIEEGLAKEKENDYSATGVHARFSPSQIQFGSAWETFAHLDTPFHTKLLQVRSPLEQYQRREVYGKDWQDWASPIEDYMIPWYQNWISKAPVGAIMLGAGMGYLFGTDGKAGRFGRLMGAMIGGAASLLGVTYVNAFSMATGEKWIPERREKERDIEEYFDILKYVKYRGLYEEAADEALRKDGFNVRAYLKRQQVSGDIRKQKLYQLKEAKRQLTTGHRDGVKNARDLVGGQNGVEAYKKAINKEINELTNERKVERLSARAAQAIQFYNESEKTMYAYDPGDPIANILSALPKKERIYVSKFLEAPEEERDDILDVVPDYVKRVLQSAWGMPVDEKPNLVEYFKHKQLPTAEWVGWDPRANLDDIKLKVVKHEGMDLSEFNMWHEDEKRAERVQDDVVPSMDMQTNAGIVKKRLYELLGEAGMKNVNVEVQPTRSKGIEMDVNILRDRRSEIIQQMNEGGYSLI